MSIWYRILKHHIDYFENFRSVLKSLKANYSNYIIEGNLSINSLRKKFEIFSSLIADTFDIFMIWETKLDYTCTAAQYSLNEFYIESNHNDLNSRILFCAREMLIVHLWKKICILNILFLTNKLSIICSEISKTWMNLWTSYVYLQCIYYYYFFI